MLSELFVRTTMGVLSDHRLLQIKPTCLQRRTPAQLVISVFIIISFFLQSLLEPNPDMYVVKEMRW